MDIGRSLRALVDRSSLGILRPLQLRSVRQLVEAAAAGGREQIDELAGIFLGSRVSEVADAAGSALEALPQGSAFDYFCDLWVEARNPRLWEVIQRSQAEPTPSSRGFVGVNLKRRRLHPLRTGSPGLARAVIDAHWDPDPEIAGVAPHALGQLRGETVTRQLLEMVAVGDPQRTPLAIEVLAHARTPVERELIASSWAVTRQPDLERLVSANRAVPAAPVETRIVVLALLADVAALSRVALAETPALCQVAGSDPDARVTQVARVALGALADRDAQDFVCRLATQGNAVAREAALAGSYLPRSGPEAAHYLFATGQQARFDDVDPDRALLRAYHQGLQEPQRRDLSVQIRASGWRDMLSVLLGDDYMRHPESWTQDDLRRIVDGLLSEERWDQAWRLAFEVSPVESALIVERLARAGWQPSGEDDREALQELIRLVAKVGSRRSFSLAHQLPPAARMQMVSTNGAVNAVAFSPLEPLVALGLSERRVVIWDYTQARIRAVSGSLPHSIAHLAYTSQGRLVGGERTSSGGDCGVHLLDVASTQWSRLHQGSGSITALEHVASESVLISDRGGRLTVLNVGSRQIEASVTMSTWAREARVAPDAGSAVLLHEGATIVSLPGLSRIASAGSGGGVVRNGAFTGQAGVVALGRHNGELRLSRQRAGRLIGDRQPLHVHRSRVQGVEYARGRNVIVSGSADGDVRFFSADGGQPVGALPKQSALRSLNVSRDGAFLAIGHTDNHMTFWDMRVMDIAVLLAQPLALAKPTHLVTVRAAAQAATRDQFALNYLSVALRYRFRYAVQIDDVRTIRRGDYDITI